MNFRRSVSELYFCPMKSELLTKLVIVKTVSESKLSINPETRQLFIGGKCPDAVSACGAICCRSWNVLLDSSEIESGEFESEMTCLVSNNPCCMCQDVCVNRFSRLKKTSNGSCIYLGHDKLCSIYEKRPLVCQSFNCFGGWDLQTAKADPDVQITESERFRKYSLTGFSDGMIFVANLHEKLKAVFFSRELSELVFVKKHISKCGVVTQNDSFEFRAMTEDMISYIIGECDGEKNIGNIIQSLKDKFENPPKREELAEMITLLCRQKLLVFVHPTNLDMI